MSDTSNSTIVHPVRSLRQYFGARKKLIERKIERIKNSKRSKRKEKSKIQIGPAVSVIDQEINNRINKTIELIKKGKIPPTARPYELQVEDKYLEDAIELYKKNERNRLLQKGDEPNGVFNAIGKGRDKLDLYDILPGLENLKSVGRNNKKKELKKKLGIKKGFSRKKVQAFNSAFKKAEKKAVSCRNIANDLYKKQEDVRLLGEALNTITGEQNNIIVGCKQSLNNVNKTKKQIVSSYVDSINEVSSKINELDVNKCDLSPTNDRFFTVDEWTKIQTNVDLLSNIDKKSKKR